MINKLMTIRFNETGGAPYGVTLRLADAAPPPSVTDGVLAVNGNLSEDSTLQTPRWYYFPLIGVKFWYVEVRGSGGGQ